MVSNDTQVEKIAARIRTILKNTILNSELHTTRYVNNVYANIHLPQIYIKIEMHRYGEITYLVLCNKNQFELAVIEGTINSNFEFPMFIGSFNEDDICDELLKSVEKIISNS